MSPSIDPGSPNQEQMVPSDTALPRIGSLPTRSYHFDDLRLQVDHRLQIDPPAARPGEHFYTRLLGFLKGSSLIVRLPAAWNGTIPLAEGDTVLVRGFSGRIAYAFNCDVLKVRHLPYSYCHLSYPAEIQGAEIRKAVRVRVSIPARLSNLAPGSTSGQEATISDLSALGVQADCAIPLGEPGQHVAISFRFWLQPNDYEVNFNAGGIIQSSHQADNAAGWCYGIRFQNMRSTEAILLQHLIYEQLMEKHAAII
ncbi:MAG TPA: flagellar brake protein [Novimethylophilus sp.]|uniref:flagellar brake protein n=1 Tax=Novimethylophilus sp. TaxID=2137426 RepID=UPI002F3E74CF